MTEPQETRPTTSRVKIGILAALAIVTVIVILQNTEAVETKLLFFSVSMPRAVLILVAYVLGTVSGLLLATRFGKGAKAKKKEESKPA